MSEFLTFTIIHPRLTLGKINLFNVLVNIAFNKPAHMQYLLNLNDNTHNAKNVVDGRISDRTLDGGQCAISAGRDTATWWVNLTGIRSIHHINIFYMIGKRPWGISTFFYSDAQMTWLDDRNTVWHFYSNQVIQIVYDRIKRFPDWIFILGNNICHRQICPIPPLWQLLICWREIKKKNPVLMWCWI